MSPQRAAIPGRPSRRCPGCGLRPFWTEQPRYSILNRTPEASVFPAVARHGMGAITFGPLAGGWLSGRADPTTGYRAGLHPHTFDQQTAANRAKLAAAEELAQLAGDLGTTMPALATAFVRATPPSPR